LMSGNLESQDKGAAISDDRASITLWSGLRDPA
jgi:hypothetical protein